MARCKSCIHDNVCNRDVGHGYSVCPHFLNAADVVPKSEVAREIFEEIEKIIQSAYYVDELGEWHEETLLLGGIDKLKKKYTEDDNE